MGVHPELIVLVGLELLGVEPHSAGGGLTHLLAGGREQERKRQPEGVDALKPANEIGAREDLGPLVVTTDLQEATETAMELEEVVGLEQLVVELDERQPTLE